MAIHDMSCPRCGKVSTEWQEGKWRCLSCGNYFLFKDDPAPLTVVNSNVSIAGDALYDLDTSKTLQPVPLTTPWLKLNKLEDDPDYVALKNGQINPVGLFSICIGIGVIVIIGVLGADLPVLVAIVAGIAAGSVPLALFYRSINRLKIKLAERLEYLTNLQVFHGQAVHCPNCRQEFWRTAGDSPAPTGLTHCLSCGKQFFLGKGLVSIPLKTHRSASVMPNIIPVPVVIDMPESLPPTPSPMIECPFCDKGIPKSAVMVGMNTCPHCQKHYETELVVE